MPIESSNSFDPRVSIDGEILKDAAQLLQDVRDGLNGKKRAEWDELNDPKDVTGIVESDLEREILVDLSQLVEVVRFSLARVGVDIEQHDGKLHLNLDPQYQSPDIFVFRNAMVDAINNVINIVYPNLSKHQRQVASIAREMLILSNEEFSTTDLEAAYHGAAIHDIGKLFIDKRILEVREKIRMPEVLREFAKHPRVGKILLEDNKVFNDPRILDIVEGHHERISGTGYPNRLHGGQMSTPMRYVTVADSFATATDNQRTYATPLKIREALRDIMLRCSPFRFPDQLSDTDLQAPWYDIEDFKVLLRIMMEKIEKHEIDESELLDNLSDEQWEEVVSYRKAA